MNYQVIIADNFHYMDEDAHYTHGTFTTLDLAVAACKKIVDEYLASAYEHGMRAEELYSSYKAFGEDPFIRCDEPVLVIFSAWDYASERCDEICGAGRADQR